MFRKSRAARTMAALLACAVCVLAAEGALAAGNTVEWQDTVVIDTDSNMVLAGGRVSPGKPVPENFVAAGGRVVIDQPVGQNAVAVGGSVEIHSPVGQNLRAAGGSITVDSPVGGSFAGAGGDVRVTRAGTIGQDARIYGGSVVIDGRISGNLKASGEKLIINGEVLGDVKAAAGTIELGPNARISGSLKYASDTEPKDVKGKVAGAVIHLDEAAAATELDAQAKRSSGFSLAGTITSFVMLLACGALFLAAAPIFTVEAPERIQGDALRSVGMGLLTVIGAPILAVLFLVTIVGIPVAMLLLALYPFSLVIGFIVGTLWVASFVPRVLRWPPPPTVKAAIGHLAIALAIVLLLAKIPVLGGWILTVVLIAGVGAFELQLYRRMRSGSHAVSGRVEVVRP